MFPLFESEYKQMRHEQFIAHTITHRHFPTLWPELAAWPKKLLREGTGPPQAQASERGPPELRLLQHTHNQEGPPKCNLTQCACNQAN